MTTVLPPQIDGRAARLRAEFDHAFALPRRGPADDGVDLLRIRVGARRCLLQLTQVASLHARLVPARLPRAAPEVLGLVGIGGRLVAVVDLCRLLGLGAGGEARWLVRAIARPVALAFDGFDGQCHVAGDALVAATERGETLQPHVRLLARIDDRGDGDSAQAHAWCPVIDLPSVLATLGGAAAGYDEEGASAS